MAPNENGYIGGAKQNSKIDSQKCLTSHTHTHRIFNTEMKKYYYYLNIIKSK